MSSPYQGMPTQVCPRCKVTLPLAREITCYNCGYRIGPSQGGGVPVGGPPATGMPLSPRPLKLPSVPLKDSQPSAAPGKALIGPPPMVASGPPQTSQPHAVPKKVTMGPPPPMTSSSPPQTSRPSAVPSTGPAGGPQFAAPGGMPQVFRPAAVPSGPLVNSQPYPAQGWNMPATPPPVPVVAAQWPGMMPQSVPRPVAPAPQLSSSVTSRARRRVNTTLRDQPPMTYVLGVIGAFLLFSALVMHNIGVSLSTITPHAAPKHVAAYPTPKSTPLLADSFVNDGLGWNLQSRLGSYSVTVGSGNLSLESDKHGLLWELLPGERSFGNFIMTVDATLAKGDQNSGYGIYIRGAPDAHSDLATYYRFELYGDSSYALFKGVTDGAGSTTDLKLVGYTVDTAIAKQGEVNHIMIRASGHTLSLIVNDQLLKTVTDTSYATGSVAFFVANLPQSKTNAQVQFSHLALYPA